MTQTLCRVFGAVGLSMALHVAWAQSGAPQPSSAPSVPTAAVSASPDVFSLTVEQRNTAPIPRPDVRQDDEWRYRRSAGPSSNVLDQKVVQLTEAGISLRTQVRGSIDSSTTVHDRQWGLLGSGYNDYLPALGYYAFPLYQGKRWRIDSQVSNFGAGQRVRIQGEGEAVGFEEVKVPAGVFWALRVQIELETVDPGDATRTVKVKEVHWYAREAMRPVKVEAMIDAAGAPPRMETTELLDFKLK